MAAKRRQLANWIDGKHLTTYSSIPGDPTFTITGWYPVDIMITLMAISVHILKSCLVHFLGFRRLLRLLRKQLTTYSSIPGDARFTITGYSGHPHGYLCSYQGIRKIESPFFKISFNGLSGSSWRPTLAYLKMLHSPSLHIVTNLMVFCCHENKIDD